MAVSASVAHDLTTCPICLDTFDSPRSLPCVHSFCLKCIQGHCEAQSKCPLDDVPCPVCRKEFKIPSDGVLGLPRNFFIQGLIDGRQITSRLSGEQSGAPCEVCLDDTGGSRASDVPAATKYCVDCDQKLCKRCSRPHLKMRGEGHEVKALGPELQHELLKARERFCDKHKDKRVELYCFTCQENICVLCSAVRHSDHKRGEISELATDFKSQINSDKEQVATRISQLRRQVKVIQDRRNLSIAVIDKIDASIKAAGEKARLILDRQKRKRLGELQSVKEKQTKMAAAAEDRLQLELVAAESFHRYSCELADKGRPSDVTGAAAELHSRAGELLGDDVISINYSAPQVTFTPADVTTLTQTDCIGRLRVSDYKVGQILHTLPEGRPVCGVASLGDHVYVLRDQAKDHVEVYEAITFRLERLLTVPNARAFIDMTSCEHFLCLYIGDHNAECIHRLDVQDTVTKWPVNDEPAGLSVTPDHNLLVTCRAVRKVKEFSSRGDLVREITLPDDIVSPNHAIQMPNGQFAVCHSGFRKAVGRVVVISSDGQHIVHSNNRQGGSTANNNDMPNVGRLL